MTREEIESLSNSELDVAVAASILGMQVTREQVATLCRNDSEWGMLPSFSSNPAAFCALLDKLEADGWFVSITSKRGEAVVSLDKNVDPEYEASAPTRYVALCRAALLAYSSEAK